MTTTGEQVTTPVETCDEMLRELELEIPATQASMRNRGLAIKVIEPLPLAAPFCEYRLTLAEAPPPIRAEEIVLLKFSNRPPVAGHVVGMSDHTVRVATSEALGTPLPRDGRLVLDSTWLLERLRSRLKGVRDTLADDRTLEGFNSDLAQLAAGRGDFDRNDVATGVCWPAEHASHIATAIDSLNEGQRHAVQLALARRVLYLWGPPGTGKTMTLSVLVLAHVLAGRRVLVLTPSNAAADVIAIATARRLEAVKGYDRGLVLRLGPRPGDALLNRHGSHVVPHLVAARLCEATYGAQRTFLEQAMAEAQRAAECGESRDQREAAQQIARIEAELSALGATEDAFVARTADELLASCRVGIAPVHHIYISHQIRGDWDVVIVDEASMVTGPQLYLAAGRAASQVVVAGDFLQLPAPVVYPRPAEVPWLSADPFERLGIPEDVAREDDPSYMVMLTEQHRMAPAIADLVSTTFYGERLSTAPEVLWRPIPAWTAHPRAGSLVLVDTTGLAPHASIPRGTKSRVNPIHATVAADIVRTLLESRDALAADNSAGLAGSVLVLSPYASQVSRLRDLLAPMRRAHRQLRASTVHRAQGDEAETVVFCLDDAPGARTSRFLTARSWTEVGARLLNVGLSRARGRLIVLAPVEHLLRTGGPVVKRLLEMLLDQSLVLEWELAAAEPKPETGLPLAVR